MSRLSLCDRDGVSTERNLPLCRMCCKLFAIESSTNEDSADRRIAAFRPCGHVFHYSCIMERYQRMEDACTCVTCFSKIDDLPMVLFMEWSKSSRPLSQAVTAELESLAAPDVESLGLRDELDMLKERLNSIRVQKDGVIRKLNFANDSTAIAKAECEGLDEVCDLMGERLTSFLDNYKKEAHACEELSTRIKRDMNRAVIGELLIMIDGAESEAKLTEMAYSNLSKSADPDDLLAKLTTLYEYYHRKVKEETKSVAQLRTTFYSLKKDAEDEEQRMIASERAKLVKKVVTKQVTSRKPAVVDRKVNPSHPVVNRARMEDDELTMSRKRQKGSNYSQLFS